MMIYIFKPMILLLEITLSINLAPKNIKINYFKFTHISHSLTLSLFISYLKLNLFNVVKKKKKKDCLFIYLF